VCVCVCVCVCVRVCVRARGQSIMCAGARNRLCANSILPIYTCITSRSRELAIYRYIYTYSTCYVYVFSYTYIFHIIYFVSFAPLFSFAFNPRPSHPSLHPLPTHTHSRLEGMLEHGAFSAAHIFTPYVCV
jgi:hypothetical protein